ncbi:hypothetical protein [Sphingosinicella sp. LY1275]|uniref:hypothetical protein n=1 Tax=Sphingosinicella sp. LY1275 TaxID=3095379 RepID=UPI002ADEEAE7|nr:hypothetical protein [Sphingosinicella sp. LY1275]MEA1015179.1 hypothetical protein [Sphingosinicella sp. LY1275]
MVDPTPRRRPTSSWFLRVFAVFLAVIGLVLFAGGVWLVLLGGSLYYLLAGAGLVLSGVLLFRGRVIGAWLYIGVFLLTLAWALWEVGLDGLGLVPRVIGPAILLVMTLLILPVPEASWRRSRHGTRPRLHRRSDRRADRLRFAEGVTQ